MVTTKTIECDNCKQKIEDETSHYPNHTRYWRCEPVFSRPESMMYAVYVVPNEPKDYCNKCFEKMRKGLTCGNSSA